jgi:hypothetical protein
VLSGVSVLPLRGLLLLQALDLVDLPQFGLVGSLLAVALLD